MQERQQSMTFDATLMTRLRQRFYHRNRRVVVESSTSPDIPSQETLVTEADDDKDRHGIGSIIRNDARADVLQQKMDFEPLFTLRGVDVFQTDCAEAEMGTHPFLIKYVVYHVVV
jgi:hypothetical protein